MTTQFETPLGFVTIAINNQPTDFKVVKRPPWEKDSTVIAERYYLQMPSDQLQVGAHICLEFNTAAAGVYFDYDTDECEIWMPFTNDDWLVSLGIAMPFHWDEEPGEAERYRKLRNGGGQLVLPLNTPDYVAQIERGIGVAWLPNTTTDERTDQMLAAYIDFASEPDI